MSYAMQQPGGPARIDPGAVYTDGEVRLLLNVPSSTLARARRTGGLRFSRLGRRIVYRGDWLLRWIDGLGRNEEVRNDAPPR